MQLISFVSQKCGRQRYSWEMPRQSTAATTNTTTTTINTNSIKEAYCQWQKVRDMMTKRDIHKNTVDFGFLCWWNVALLGRVLHSFCYSILILLFENVLGVYFVCVFVLVFVSYCATVSQATEWTGNMFKRAFGVCKCAYVRACSCCIFHGYWIGLILGHIHIPTAA